GYDSFVKRCTDLALAYYPNSITAHQINANYFKTLSNFVVYQYSVKKINKAQFNGDQQAQTIITSAKGAAKKIENLGYSEMPAEAYEAWLKSIQRESYKQQSSKEIKLLGGMIEKR
ncbi:MAG TPA: hypothetical protein VK462_08745, partial [Nitrososphaeraceae archaeon]|nr:hypothetical protein [Nitrososphaeraceae archaeon]